MAREIKWQNKTEEEVKEISLEEFMKMIPARSRRSLKRGFTHQQKMVLEAVEQNDNNIKTHARNMVIVPAMLGKTIKIYNGKEFIPLTVTLEMLGHCLGEFSLTRKMLTHGSAGIGATRSSKTVSAK